MADRNTGTGTRPPLLARRLRLARLTLLVEDLLVRLWRAGALLAILLGVTLLGLWTALPGVVHVALLGLALAAVVWLLAVDLRGLAWPSEAAALRRLERASGFSHRPLLALDDPFAGDPADEGSRALFEAHRRRMAQRLRAIRVGAPLSAVARVDRLALRSIGVVVLAAGLIAGWSEARAHLLAAVSPDFSKGLSAPDPVGQLTLWITPPAYTGVAPLWLDALEAAAVDRPLSLPAGSEVVAQVRGGTGAPELVIDATAVPFAAAGEGSHEIVHVVETGNRLAVRQAGREIAAWPIAVVPDSPPAIALTEAPQETLRTALRLDVAASDDYGLDSIVGTVRLAERPDEEPLRLLVPIPRAGVTETAGPAFFGLMTHPWAGMAVTLTLTATDVVGQTTTTEPVALELPERYFYHPVAREIADRRQQLVRDPGTAEEVADSLAGLAQDPSAFLDDTGVFLGLVVAADRLRTSPVPEEQATVVELMWDLAVDVEEGPLAFAEERVREIQERLLEALSEGASDPEIERLIDELRQAMDEYMRALSNRLRTDPGELFDPTDALKAVGSRELTDLVEQIRDLLRTGSREQAQTLLSRLQEIMENISVGNLSDLTGAISPEAAEVLHTIRQLMSGQQELLDETFRSLRETDGADSQRLFREQEALRGTLQEMMERMQQFGFGESREFERADRSMERAARQLEADRPAQAIDHETAAIDQLRAGADALMQELIEQAGEQGEGDGANYFAAPRDPMGRNLGGAGQLDASDIELPEKGALMKAREILDELYRRAGEQHRPPDEQLYLERLLRRF